MIISTKELPRIFQNHKFYSKNGKINLKRKVLGFEDLNCVAALKKSGPLIGE